MQWIIILLGVGLAWGAPSEDAERLLKSSSELLNGGKTFALAFQVDVHYEVTGEDQSYGGDLLLGKSDRFRLRTPQSQVQSDGVNLWQYNPAHKQVLIKSLLDLEGGLHPSEILFRYLKCKPLTAEKRKLDGRETWLLKLDPKGQLKAYREMDVWLDAKDFSPVRIRTIDINGNESRFQVKDFRSVQASDEEFIWKTLPGVEEIDMR